MADNIQVLEETLQGGARENRFRVNFVLPSGVSGDVRNLSILVKTATLPGKTSGQIEIKHSGLTHRIKGDEVTDATWTTEVLVPKNATTVYGAFESWFKLIENYKVNMTAEQLDIQNNVTQVFTLEGVWVTALPAVNFSTESQDTLKSFEVTYSVDKLVIGSGSGS